MSQNPEEKVSDNSCKGVPIFLLLFVGFLIGLITGFATKDAVMRSYFKMMNSVVVDTTSTEQPVTPAVRPAQPGATEKVDAPADTTEKKDEEKKDEEKKDEEKKDEAKPAEGAAPAPAPAPAS